MNYREAGRQVAMTKQAGLGRLIGRLGSRAARGVGRMVAKPFQRVGSGMIGGAGDIANKLKMKGAGGFLSRMAQRTGKSGDKYFKRMLRSQAAGKLGSRADTLKRAISNRNLATGLGVGAAGAVGAGAYGLSR